MFILERNWGNDGYAFWFKLLELLCSSEGHYYDCNKRTDIEYLASYVNMDMEQVNNILDMLADMGKIDKKLWSKKLIWCQTLVDNLAPLYAKRTVELPDKPLVNNQEEQVQEPDTQPDMQKKDEAKDNKKKRKSQDKPPKKQYAEFVLLTEAEYNKLVEDHGEKKTRLFIEKLDNYKGSSGKKYASDYRAILNWVIERVNDDLAKGSYKGNGNDEKQREDFKPSGGFRE